MYSTICTHSDLHAHVLHCKVLHNLRIQAKSIWRLYYLALHVHHTRFVIIVRNFPSFIIGAPWLFVWFYTFGRSSRHRTKQKKFKLFRSSMYTYNILTNTSHSLRIYWLWIIVGFTMPGNKNKKNPSVLQFAIPLDGIWLSSKLIQMEKASSIRNSNATITAKQQKLF